MALFGLVDTSKLEEFAATLADDLARRFPPASESRTDVGAQNQLRIIMEGLSARALRFHNENQLGVYKKAKLANVFKWRLKEAGYSQAFIEKVTKDLVTQLAVR